MMSCGAVILCEPPLVAIDVDWRTPREVVPRQPPVGCFVVEEVLISFADEDPLTNAGMLQAVDMLCEKRRAVRVDREALVKADDAHFLRL